ncbi:hypothetical protein jhhlp_007062 [Lomentospora prolificans]|uniref:Uncharacterized protein n=1 Tax=Lomentospora prolificans TaxID=41688 RepID=A0A2N3N1K0_9PEZI|nr:hypothetical protein jhhlp_007062 [Lomentospora prolificans]
MDSSPVNQRESPSPKPEGEDGLQNCLVTHQNLSGELADAQVPHAQYNQSQVGNYIPYLSFQATGSQSNSQNMASPSMAGQLDNLGSGFTQTGENIQHAMDYDFTSQLYATAPQGEEGDAELVNQFMGINVSQQQDAYSQSVSPTIGDMQFMANVPASQSMYPGGWATMTPSSDSNGGVEGTFITGVEAYSWANAIQLPHYLGGQTRATPSYGLDPAQTNQVAISPEFQHQAPGYQQVGSQDLQLLQNPAGSLPNSHFAAQQQWQQQNSFKQPSMPTSQQHSTHQQQQTHQQQPTTCSQLEGDFSKMSKEGRTALPMSPVKPVKKARNSKNKVDQSNETSAASGAGTSKGESANRIPLLCYACPGEPIFSDVSHLLTHVSSKGHLGNARKLELRALTDDDARQMLEKYIKWEEDNGVKSLLAQRLAQREMKDEKKRKAQETLTNDEEGMDNVSPKYKGKGKGRADCSGSTIDSDIAMDQGGPKLKGKVYPGMGVFDAATPEQKRLRNQRKDSTIASQLKAASEAVQPIEQVFDMNLNLIRTRGIYDPPSPPPGTPVGHDRAPLFLDGLWKLTFVQAQTPAREVQDSAAEQDDRFVVVTPEHTGGSSTQASKNCQ